MKKICTVLVMFFLVFSFAISLVTAEEACKDDPYKSDIDSWNTLAEERIEEFLEKVNSGEIEDPIAVFDADGTLWQNDIGESFFRWLIENKKLVGADYSEDFYQKYEDLLEKDDVDTAFTMLITLMAGIKEEDLKSWSSDYFETFKHNVFPMQKELIERLHNAGVEVWVVSASNRWSVEAGALYFGIEPENVIAMKVKVKDGILTDEFVPPVLHGEGKVEAIKEYIGDRVDFVCGNSRSDYNMLDFSSEMSLIINPSDKVGAIAGTDGEETSLSKEAEENGWAIQKWNKF